MSLNGISTLSTKQAKQLAKLGLAQTKRQGFYSSPVNGSILLDGTQYITIPANSAYTLGTNDHTIEFWLYQSNRGLYDVAWTYCQVLQLKNNSYYLNVGSEGVYLLLGTAAENAWGVQINPPTPSLNAWHHYAIVRYGNVFTLYVDGVGYSQTYNYNIPAQTGVMSLGKHIGLSSTGIPGYVSNFRFVNGTAVYKQNFTPSEATLPNVPNTKILLNTVYGPNFLVDRSSIGANVTNVGSATSSPQYPNAVVTASTTASFYRTRNNYDITQLPTQFGNNDIIDNPNTGGLVEGRPWTSVTQNDFKFSSNDNQWVINDEFVSGSTFSDPAPSNPTFTYPDSSTGKTYDFNGTTAMFSTDLEITGAWQSNTITVDFWFYPTANTVQLLTELSQPAFNLAFHTTILEISSTGNIKARFWQGHEAEYITTSTNTVDLNRWNHIYFIERANGTHAFELNGVATTGTPTYTRITPQANEGGVHFAIGGYDNTNMGQTGGFQGKIGNLNLHDYIVASTYSALVSKFRPVAAPVTQDLILFFDSERTDCYPGTGTTIYNIVDLPAQTPSTLFGDVTFSNGLLRISNTDTAHPTNRVSGIQCQTVTGFKTISLWYRQLTSSAGYYSYIVDARGGMPGGWIYDTPANDWFGSDWGAGTMFINGGASQSPTYTQQLNVWRNVTFVTNGTAFTDDIALFSRNNHIEGLDVEFGAVMIYSRTITEAENKQNYDQFKTRYGLS